MLTELVERTFGNIVPVKVKLSPPSKLSVLAGNKLVKVQVMVSAVKVSLTGIIPRLLVRIGKWYPQVGSSSKVHWIVVSFRPVALRVISSIVQRV